MSQYKNISFYKFKTFESLDLIRETLYISCKQLKILGTLIIAPEGLNGMLAGIPEAIDKILPKLREIGIDSNNIKTSFSEIKPFNRLRIKIKEEIISLGDSANSNPNKKVGDYVQPKHWNNIIENKNVLLIDTRNYYETSIGTFENSLVPSISSFKEFPKFIKNSNISKDKEIAMFCTGGIRCEKASSYMLQLGFKKVYHLEGGIIKYLEDVPIEQSKWQGECFVFDNRVAIEHELSAGSYILCNACGEPLSKVDISSHRYKKGIHCPLCFDNITEEKIQKVTERQKQIELAKLRGEVHIGE